MSLYKRLIRWLWWKRIPRIQRRKVAKTMAFFDGPDCWEMKQWEKETDEPSKTL